MREDEFENDGLEHAVANVLGIEADLQEDAFEVGIIHELWNIVFKCDVNDLVREVCSELCKQTMIFTSGSMVVCFCIIYRQLYLPCG